MRGRKRDIMNRKTPLTLFQVMEDMVEKSDFLTYTCIEANFYVSRRGWKVYRTNIFHVSKISFAPKVNVERQ